MANVDSLMSQVKQGFARSNRYKVEIALPIGAFGLFSSTGLDKTIDDYITTSALGGLAGTLLGSVKSFVNIPSVSELVSFGLNKAGVSTANICLNCEATQLPGLSFAQSERIQYGPSRKYPFREIYVELPMSFYCSKDMAEKSFFDMWFAMMVNRETHDMNFVDEYKSTIVISQLDDSLEGKVVYKVKLEDAFPTSITPVELGYANENQVSRFTVNMAYTSWKPVAIDLLDLGNTNISNVVSSLTR